MINFINPQDFISFLEDEKMPVFISCFENIQDFQAHQNAIENISQIYAGKLRVCLLNSEYKNLMVENFGIYGTPAFVICHKGKRKSMMLGKMSLDKIKSFVQSSRIYC